MKSPNWLFKNRSSDPYPQNKTRYNQFVEVAFGVRAPFGRPSPLTPIGANLMRYSPRDTCSAELCERGGAL